MKKIYLLPALALLMGACANDNNLTPTVDTPTQLEGKVTGYVNVQIVMPGSINSRAEGDPYNDKYPQGGGYYVDGTASENYVTNVRFYFFDKDGNSVRVRKNPNQTDSYNLDYFSFIDWTPALSDVPIYPGQNDENGLHDGSTIEKQYKTTLVLSQPSDVEEEEEPALVVAVVNPPAEVLGMIDLSNISGNGTDLDKLSAVVSNYETGFTDNNFVMSNSVYLSEGTLVNYSKINESIVAADQIQTQDDLQEMDYVTIYVERVVARVDFSIDLKDANKAMGNNIYNISKKFEPTEVTESDELEDQDIYLQVEGWALASFPSESFLIKNINEKWPTENNKDFFKLNNNPWNSADYHRSFWAINPEIMTYNFYSFNEIGGTNKKGNAPTVDTPYNSIYTQENANPYADGILASSEGSKPEAPTQVIFVGQLGTLNTDGKSITPTTICEYRGKHYTEKGVKTLICNNLDMYKIVEGEYKKVDESDLKFITQEQWLGLNTTTLDPNPSTGNDDDNSVTEPLPDSGKALGTRVAAPQTAAIDAETLNGKTPGRYYSFLVPANEGEKFYHLANVDEENPYEEISNVPQYIYESLNYARIKVWNQGRTYFFSNIRHLGKKSTDQEEGSIAEFGIVRNHIYDVKYNAISGFGTPVLDPDETIYPEKPESEPDDIEVTINILSWRLVTDEYEVSW